MEIQSALKGSFFALVFHTFTAHKLVESKIEMSSIII